MIAQEKVQFFRNNVLKKWHGISAQMKELILEAGTNGTEKAEYRLIINGAKMR